MPLTFIGCVSNSPSSILLNRTAAQAMGQRILALSYPINTPPLNSPIKRLKLICSSIEGENAAYGDTRTSCADASIAFVRDSMSCSLQ